MSRCFMITKAFMPISGPKSFTIMGKLSEEAFGPPPGSGSRVRHGAGEKDEAPAASRLVRVENPRNERVIFQRALSGRKPHSLNGDGADGMRGLLLASPGGPPAGASSAACSPHPVIAEMKLPTRASAVPQLFIQDTAARSRSCR